MESFRMEFSEIFKYKNEKCIYCNGYYGPCFGQPVCATCHALLYPDDASHQHNIGPYQEKTDDGDSGNEEPKEPSDFHQMQQQQQQNDPQQPTPQQQQQQLLPQPIVDGNLHANRAALVEDAGEVDFQEGAASMPGPEPPGDGTVAVVNNPIASMLVMSGRNNGLSTNMGNIATRSFLGSGGGVRETLQERINLLTCPRPPDNLDPSLIHRIPPEVLMFIFDLLDDMTLWSVYHVCQRWHNLVAMFVTEAKWKQYTKRRWPLFRPLYAKVPWQQVYTNLIESAPCQICLYQMLLPATPPANENSWRRNRLRNELRTLRSDPPEGIEASPLDEMSLHWQASIRGPASSPYEGGTFFLYIQIPPSYPLCPPIVRFITKIFHPNVSRHGDVGIDSIQHNWSLALTISKVLISIQSLLTDPYTKVCMEPDIGKLYENNKNLFERVARSWTHQHAMHDGLIPDSPSNMSALPTCGTAAQGETEDGMSSNGGRNEMDSCLLK
ncbi:hypothetical protein SK128_024404 [Halocaridina rubra]|uniref:E2 ubiquitin-conjugating enzyme n=1 Tax=Halocaridina rubra TaxID=373956 RepID=A0AAN8WWF7_HALRR